MLCLVTGATGYIGGRLVPELLAAGHEVRVLARHPERLVDRTWVNDVQVVSGDAGDPDAVRAALKGVDVIAQCAGQFQCGPARSRASKPANTAAYRPMPTGPMARSCSVRIPLPTG